MNDTQLEAMVVRLYGDGSSYQQMMGQAVNSSRTAMQQTQQYTQQVEGFGTALTGFASTAMTALGALGAASFLRKAFGQFAEHETTVIRLSAAIRGNGSAVEATLPAYEAWAKVQRETAGISTDASLNLLRTAESYRLSGSAALAASQDAIALSFATRGNADAAEHMIRLTAAMAQGNVHMAQQMGRIVPQLRQFHNDAAGFTAAYQRLITTGVATSVDVMNSAEGTVRRYNMAWQALTKQFGQFVAEAALPVIRDLTAIILGMSKLDGVSKTLIVSTALIVTGMLAVGPAIASVGFIANLAFSPIALIVGAAGAALTVWIAKVGGFTNAIVLAKQYALEFVDTYQNLLLAVGAGIVAVGAAVAVYRVLVFTLSTVSAVLTVLRVYQVTGLILWAAQSAAVLVAQVLLAAYNFQLGVWLFLLKGGWIATVVWVAGVTLAKVATWLWNASLTVANALLAGLTFGLSAFLALMGTFYIAVGGFVLLGAAGIVAVGVVSGLVAAGYELYNVFASIPSTAGGIVYITGLFGEWKQVLLDVFRAARTDLPLAWSILAAGARLAFSQLKDLAAPAWLAVQSIAEDTWTVIWITFKYKTVDAMADAFLTVDGWLTRAGRAIWDWASAATVIVASALSGQFLVNYFAQNAQARAAQQQAMATATGASGMLRTIEEREAMLARQRILQTLTGFNVPDSPETQRLREELRLLTAQIRDDVTGTVPPAAAVANQMAIAAKEAHKFDAALVNSREALYRMADYQAMLAQRPGATAGQPSSGPSPFSTPSIPSTPGAVAGSPVTPAASGNLAGVEALLRSIRTVLIQANNRPGVQIVEANL